MSMTNTFINTIKNNLFFLVPFVIWLVVGGILLATNSQETLFFGVNSYNSHFLDHAMTVLSGYGRGDCIPIILTSLLVIPAMRNRYYITTALSFAIIIPLIIYYLKLFYGCSRPLIEYGNERVHTVPWLDNAFYNSYPSGHTIGAFGFFLILCLFLPKTQKAWSVLFFTLALGCGYSRMYLGQHFFKDVYVGSSVGVVIVFILYIVTESFHLKRLSSNESN
jgi:membrane-associated phospholipid phosphatase